LLAITPFETHQGDRRLGRIGLLASLQLGEAHRAQTRSNMNAQLTGSPRLTIAEACARLGVAEQPFDLEPRVVLTVERLG
jgi:hypothetical protein